MHESLAYSYTHSYHRRYTQLRVYEWHISLFSTPYHARLCAASELTMKHVKENSKKNAAKKRLNRSFYWHYFTQVLRSCIAPSESPSSPSHHFILTLLLTPLLLSLHPHRSSLPYLLSNRNEKSSIAKVARPPRAWSAHHRYIWLNQQHTWECCVSGRGRGTSDATVPTACRCV